MSERRWTTVDKRAWPARGAWDAEPDKVQWRDAATGLPCLAVRGPVGAWCGYAGVYPGHPWHGVAYGDCLRGCPEDADCYSHGPDVAIEVHGGLTFSDRCRPGATEARGICHAAEPGEPEPWWFGFDCAHAGDVAPRMDRACAGATYKTLDYVRDQVARLAAQLTAVTPTAEQETVHGAEAHE